MMIRRAGRCPRTRLNRWLLQWAAQWPGKKPADTMQPPRLSPIDHAFLTRFTRGSHALEREVLELFARQMPLYVAQLRAATNLQDWKQAAHSIKGSALAVGAGALAEAAQAAERADSDAGSEAAAERKRSADAVAAASDEVCAYIACLFATA
jgi:HPt (histidine-containing phosphotransfer) domain-containing protein